MKTFEYLSSCYRVKLSTPWFGHATWKYQRKIGWFWITTSEIYDEGYSIETAKQILAKIEQR